MVDRNRSGDFVSMPAISYDSMRSDGGASTLVFDRGEGNVPEPRRNLVAQS
jgi:hypothetical protein